MSDRGDETDQDSGERTAENPGEGPAPEDGTGDAGELAEDLRPTGLPALAAVLAFLAPPVGAVLGHFAVRRTYWRLGLSRLAIAAGWTMTALSACGVLLYLSHREEVARIEALAVAEEQTREQVRQAIAESPSLGLVDEEFCRVLGEVAETAPATGFVTGPEQINGAMVEGYGVLGQTDTPNARVYGDYAQYLVSFADHDADEHAAHAEDLQQAVGDDVLACLPLVNENLE
ncbi:hypothetical protein PWG71_21495 [Nocardiopsis sp. N85]|uniref:hypothetical protein n=1 Tax=Nocardiopsis sp. N85 TaxID=3029400 RepID=UPI00237FC9F4|nr:hypothetical protein [Nocardiopsis sp. N85]MDE3723973.1 hypothetical protein [Nocardiopsis sp. N85]